MKYPFRWYFKIVDCFVVLFAAAVNGTVVSGTTNENILLPSIITLIKEMEGAFGNASQRDSNGLLISLNIHCQYHDDAKLRLISQIPTISKLKINGLLTPDSSNTTYIGISYLTNMTKLFALELDCFGSQTYSPGMLENVCRINQLHELKLYYFGAPAAEYRFLSRLTNLTRVDIEYSPHFGNKELCILTNLPGLRELSLVGTGVTPEGTNVLGANSQLRSLFLGSEKPPPVR